MKRIISFVFIAVLFTVFGFNILDSNGKVGYTGSSGELMCNNCHSGGPAGTTASISASPAFTNNTYDPSLTYTITVTVAHPTQPAFGFDCEILNTSNTNAGTMSNAGAGAKLANSFNSRKNATHTAPKSGSGSASWTFVWTPPASGDVTFYLSGNAVDMSGNFSGDTPTNTTLTLTAIPAGIQSYSKNEISGLQVYPNPINDLGSISYYLASSQKITVELTDISGKTVRSLVNEMQESGPHSHIIDLEGVNAGIYFVKVLGNGHRISQKLITVQ